jgi:hypothetical protein
MKLLVDNGKIVKRTKLKKSFEFNLNKINGLELKRKEKMK